MISESDTSETTILMAGATHGMDLFKDEVNATYNDNTDLLGGYKYSYYALEHGVYLESALFYFNWN